MKLQKGILPDRKCDECEVEWATPPDTCWVCGKPAALQAVSSVDTE